VFSFFFVAAILFAFLMSMSLYLQFAYSFYVKVTSGKTQMDFTQQQLTSGYNYNSNNKYANV